MKEIETVMLVEIQNATDPIVGLAAALTIDSSEDFEKAGLFLTDHVKPVVKLINETFDPICKAAHAAHKEAVAQKKKKLEPLEQAEKLVKSRIAEWVENTTASEDGSGEEIPGKASGISTRAVWSAEVVDLKALVIAVAAGEVPIECIQPNQTRLNEMAKGLQEHMKVPGVSAVCVTSVSARASG